MFDRIDYSPIITRPKLEWPGGARIALWVVPNIEHYEYLPRPGQLRDPWPRMPHPDVLDYGRSDYGNRIGFWRMLDVIDRYQVPCTASLNLAVYEHFPEIMEACEARKWDVLCHGLYNSDYLWGLTENEEREFIAECVATHRRLTGRDLLGWFSPAGSLTVNTPDLVAEAGIKYYCDWRFDEQPFPIKVKTGRLLTLPYQLEVNDGVNFRSAVEADTFVRAAIEMFDRLYQDSSGTGRVMHLPLHPFLIGQPHRIRSLYREGWGRWGREALARCWGGLVASDNGRSVAHAPLSFLRSSLYDAPGTKGSRPR